MTSQAFYSASVCLADSLCQNVIPDENILLRQFLPITTLHFIFTFKFAACALPHEVSLVQAEYLSCMLIFLSLHLLNNNYLNIRSSVISITSAQSGYYTCSVKSEKLIEVDEGTFMPQYIP